MFKSTNDETFTENICEIKLYVILKDGGKQDEYMDNFSHPQFWLPMVMIAANHGPPITQSTACGLQHLCCSYTIYIYIYIYI